MLNTVMAARRKSTRKAKRAPAKGEVAAESTVLSTPGAPAPPPTHRSLPSAPPSPALTAAQAAFRKAAREAEARRQVLATWRGVDTRSVEIAMADRTKGPSAFMPGVMQKLGLEKKQTETEVLKVWNHLLDPDVVAHAQPAGLHKDTLFVNVDNSAWLSEIVRYRRRDILTRLQHAFGPDLITRISFRIG